MAQFDDVAGDDQVIASGNHSSAPQGPTFDEALLVRIKGKVRKPERPDEAERNVPIAKLQAEISKLGDRIKEIKDIIDAKRSAGRTVGSGTGEARSRMQGHRNEFQAVLRQKQQIRQELMAANQQRDALRTESRAVREKGRLLPEAELEDRIQKLEFDLAHSSLSPADEKRATQQLQQFAAQRPLVKQSAALDAGFKENEAVRAEINKRIAACDETLNAIKAKEDAEKAALDGVKAKADEETSDVPTLTAEKQQCWEVMQALRDKITEIRADFDKQYREWVKLDRNYNAWQRWDKQQKYEESRKERAVRIEAAQVEEVTMKGELYDAEIYTCDQTLAYLRKFVAADTAKAAADAAPVAPPEGMKLFKRRDVEEDIDMVVAPKKKGTAPKGLAAQQSAARSAAEASESASKAAAAAAAAPKAARMNNTLETLKTFMGLAIDAPVTVADVPATIEKVEAKKQHYFELRKKAKEAPAAAASSAPARSLAPAPKQEAADDSRTAASAKAAADAATAAIGKDVVASGKGNDQKEVVTAVAKEEEEVPAAAEEEAEESAAADGSSAAEEEEAEDGAAAVTSDVIVDEESESDLGVKSESD